MWAFVHAQFSYEHSKDVQISKSFSSNAASSVGGNLGRKSGSKKGKMDGRKVHKFKPLCLLEHVKESTADK